MALPRSNHINIVSLSIFLSLITTVSAWGKKIGFWDNRTQFEFVLYPPDHLIMDPSSSIALKIFGIVNDAIGNHICGFVQKTTSLFHYQQPLWSFQEDYNNVFFYRDGNSWAIANPELEECFKTFLNNVTNILVKEVEDNKNFQIKLFFALLLISTLIIGIYIYRKATPKPPTYDAQLIIDFLEHPNAPYSQYALSRYGKWLLANPDPKTCDIVRGEAFLQKTVKLQLPNKINKLRVYVMGHCWVGYDELHSDKKDLKVHFNKLAEGLAYYFQNQSIVVSLIACCAARGMQPNAEDSFGAKLHLALVSRFPNDTPVIARTSLTSLGGVTFILAELEKYKHNYNELLRLPIINQTRDRNLYIYHQENSKIMFFMQGGKQERMDAYKKTKLKLA